MNNDPISVKREQGGGGVKREWKTYLTVILYQLN